MRGLSTRRSFLQAFALISSAVGSAATGRAAPHSTSNARRIGFMVGAGFEPLMTAFRDELRRLGYVEGRDLKIEITLTGGGAQAEQQIRAAARSDVELVVVGALPFALLVREANPAMPMVIATCPGMISNGFAKSLEHPGGVVTGMDELPPGVTRQRLELLKTAAPNVSRVALLSTTPGKGGHEEQLTDAEAAAVELGIAVKPYRVSRPDQFPPAFSAMHEDRMDALLNFQGGLSLANRQLIIDFAREHRLPAIYQATLFAESGGLMSWAPDLLAQYREAARLADQILKGARPGDLPIKYPARYFLTINATAAKDIGLELPSSLVAQADRLLP